ncbi:MAG TPA: isoprenylcysteine carboxylmethyltransferase family protein [Acidimicrobiales bacterium]|nr:isoprenylcysteine carboxylmethyltransferase family protein [Acidimicrobiales bacterium]
MAVTALILYALWFALAFGLRTVMALRSTGDSGFRGISGRPLSLEWSAGVLFAVALLVGVAAPSADLAGLPPLVDSSSLAVAGLVIALVGIGGTLAAQLSMGDSWRIGVDHHERTELVTRGAFGLARNPIYTAMTITAVGLAAMVPNVIAVGGMIALIVALELQVRGVEEPYLRRVHGAAYDRYAAQVGRFLPGVGRRAA